jgi:hypothetical protein
MNNEMDKGRELAGQNRKKERNWKENAKERKSEGSALEQQAHSCARTRAAEDQD